MVLAPPNEYPIDPAARETSPYEVSLRAAKSLFDKEIDATAEWEAQGDKEDVKLEKKAMPEDRGAGIPMVRGSCIIENATTDAIVPIIQTPGIRGHWDPRFETAWIQRRFSAHSYQFYSLGNSPPGLGWIVWPRDASGIHQTYIDGKTEEGEADYGSNKEIVLIQTSVKDEERAPTQSKRTRMHVTLSGWRLRPQGKDVHITYLVKVDLGGSIPSAMRATVVQDLPVCAGKVRDVYYKYGSPPYVLQPTSLALSSRSIEQSSSFHFTPKNASDAIYNNKHYHLRMTLVSSGDFTIKYDTDRMYAKQGGIHFVTKGEGKDDVTLVDDGNGSIEVNVGQNAGGKKVEIVVSPHGGAPQE